MGMTVQQTMAKMRQLEQEIEYHYQVAQRADNDRRDLWEWYGEGGCPVGGIKKQDAKLFREYEKHMDIVRKKKAQYHKIGVRAGIIIE